MQPDSPAPRSAAADRWVLWAVAAWAVVVLAVCVRGAVQQKTHSLYLTYVTAGADWSAGASLYFRPPSEAPLEPYRYSPLVAVLLVPFHALPLGPGSALWRLLNAAALIGGFGWWVREALPRVPSGRVRAMLFLLLLPLALSSLNNGQTNPLVIGLLLAAAGAAGGGRWNLAAACVAGATALKLYPLAVGLLLAAAYPRRFAGRLAAALGVAAALPFLFGAPGYVAAQYADWARLLTADDRKFWPVHVAYRDLWLLFRVTGSPVGPRLYLLMQIAAGAGCAALVVAGRLRGWAQREVLVAAFALGTCWMTLCGPATESCTYILLAPALAWALVDAHAGGWPRGLRSLPAAAATLLLAGILAGLFPGTANFHARGPQPLGALLLSVGYAGLYLHRMRAAPERRPQAEAPSAPKAA
jgi:hypothetical protein